MKIQLENAGMRAVIDTMGAELTSLVRDEREYLWQGDPGIWDQHSPLLFPYVGRFTEGHYQLYGVKYPMTIHGFAAHSEFKIGQQSGDAVILCLTDTEKTREIYPFCFQLKVTYQLSPEGVTTSYEVENRSETTMFFGIGGHPGFRVPMDENTDFDDYYLDFHQKHPPTRVGHTAACFLSGEDRDFPLKKDRYLPLAHDLFDDDAIVLKNVSRKVSIVSEKTDRRVTMEFPQMPYLGIWHCPKTEAPYVCIEPWTSLPSRQDVIEEISVKSDLIHLEPKDTYRNGWTVTIE